jgi:hypothetical protein
MLNNLTDSNQPDEYFKKSKKWSDHFLSFGNHHNPDRSYSNISNPRNENQKRKNTKSKQIAVIEIHRAIFFGKATSF